MTFYELLLFVHILAAAIWFGAGFLFHVLAQRAERTQDTVTMRRLVDDAAVLSNQLFIPASLTVLVAGVLLVVDGPWSFGELWIVLGLLGYVATFVTGVLVIKPRSERIAALSTGTSGLTPDGVYEARRMLAYARIDIVTLLLVIAVMALKPTGDDVAVLLVLAAVLVAGGAFIFTRAQAVQAPAASGSASV